MTRSTSEAAAARRRRSSQPAERTGIPGSIGGPADRAASSLASAARALWITLALLTGARALLAFASPVWGMWGWGFDALRFLAPVPGWTLWAASALALVPALARRALPAFAAAGRTIERAPGRACVVAALLPAALVWSFPDRLRFVGDFLLRLGTAERALKPAALFPQALPLDVLLHYRIPRLLDTWLGIDVNTGARALGTLEAALLGVLAVAFASTLDLKGASAACSAAVVLGGGYLGVLTGYGKAIAEVALLTVAAAVLGLRVIRTGRGMLPLSACVAAGFVLHRSTLGLLPALGLCWVLAARAPTPVAWSRPATWAAVVIPLAVLSVMLPRMVGTFATMDQVHFTPPEVQRQGGIARAMLAGTRPADLMNVIGLLSPLALGLPVAAIALRRTSAPSREGALLLALALPWLVMLLLIHPPQGMFRDWDNMAAAATTLSMLMAWLAAAVVRRATGWAWLAVPLTLGAWVPSVQWLMHNADLERGLERVEAYLREPPMRSEEERAKTWDFLGIRYAQLDRWERSAEAMARAAELAPSPRVLLQWASAEQARGNDRGAQDVYRRLLAVAPNEARGWNGLAFVSWQLEDWSECARAARELLRLHPRDAQAHAILEQATRRDSMDARGSR